MGKSHGRFLVLLLIFFAGLVPGRDVCAQFQWLPKFVSVQIPMMVHHSFSSNVSMHSYDSSNDGALLLQFGFDSAGIYPRPNYLRNKDTVSIEYYSGSSQNSISETKSTLIHFVLDSIGNRLKDFSIEYDYQINPVSSPNGHYEYYKAFANFSVLDFNLSGDSLFIVNASGALCRTRLDSAYYSSYVNDVTDGNTYVGKNDKLDSLIKDTLSYKFSLAFTLTKLVDDVPFPNSAPQTITISTSLPDHTINISFPSSPNQQTLFIYDILGRELARKEILSGMMRYSIEFSKFLKGYYFVRLGNLSGSFIAP